METCGDVGRTDQAHDGLVDALAHAPCPKALPHVRVQVYYVFHRITPLCLIVQFALARY